VGGEEGNSVVKGGYRERSKLCPKMDSGRESLVVKSKENDESSRNDVGSLMARKGVSLEGSEGKNTNGGNAEWCGPGEKCKQWGVFIPYGGWLKNKVTLLRTMPWGCVPR